MRPIPLILAVALCTAPAFAQAGVRLHMPHGKHHRSREAQPSAAPAAPASDVPEPVWTSTATRR